MVSVCLFGLHCIRIEDLRFEVTIQVFKLVSRFFKYSWCGNFGGYIFLYNPPWVFSIKGKAWGDTRCSRASFIVYQISHGPDFRPVVLLIIDITLQVLCQDGIDPLCLTICLGVETGREVQVILINLKNLFFFSFFFNIRMWLIIWRSSWAPERALYCQGLGVRKD